MMWLINPEKKMRDMNVKIGQAFGKVRSDTQKIFQWLSYLQQQNQQQNQQQSTTIQHQNLRLQQQQDSIDAHEKTIKKLQHDLSFIPKNPDDIKRIIDQHYSFDSVMSRIQSLHHKVDALEAEPRRQVVHKVAEPAQHPDLQVVQQRLSQLEDSKKATVREKVVKRVTRNSKDYVKSLVLSYVRKFGQITGLQIKEMIVDDQGLCSKSSLYRILEELESMEGISVVWKGKLKYYLYKHSKLH